MPDRLLFVSCVDIKAGDQEAVNYLDLKASGERDKQAEKRVQTLHDILASKLNEKNKHNFFVAWQEKGLVPSEWMKHADYLESFHNTVIEQVTLLVEKALAKQASTRECMGDRKNLCKDVLCHMQHCRRVASVKMRGQEESRESIRKVLLAGRSDDHSAIIVYGPEGSGKTLLVSKVCHLVTDILGKDTLLVVRYVGLTPMSQSARDLLHCLCCHLSYLLKQDLNLDNLAHETLVAYFTNLLRQFSAGSRQLVIVLDGMENLRVSRADPQIKLDWLAAKLPPRVHLLVSYATGQHSRDIFNKLKSRLLHMDAVIAVQPLKDKSIEQIATDTLSHSKRRLTTTQEQCIVSAVRQEGCPLLAKLYLEEAVEWRSDFEVKKLKLPAQLEAAIERRFDSLENKYGRVVVEHIARYICAAHNGLSEVELLDLLSCNNDVLLQTLPARDLGHLLRFPHALWRQIRRAFGTFQRFLLCLLCCVQHH